MTVSSRGARRTIARLPTVSEWGSVSVRIGDDVAWTAEESRVVALHLACAGATPFVLETTAAFVWDEIAEEGPLTAAALVDNVAAAFGVAAEQIRPDVHQLLDELVRRELVCAQ